MSIHESSNTNLPTIIPSNDISVVIQGPLDRGLTNDCIKSIRNHLPYAEIIVSTWKDQPTHNLSEIDKLVISDDPGGITDIRLNTTNINRQIVSSQNGIQHGSRKYILKFRADLMLNSSTIASIDNSFSSQFSCYRHSKLTIGTYFTVSPCKGFCLFHASDIFMFGHRTDMIDYWSPPLATRNSLFINSPVMKHNHSGVTLQRVTPEQYLFLAWLEKKGIKIYLNYIDEFSPSLMQIAEQYLFSNFTVLPSEKTGVVYPKKFINLIRAHQCYTQSEIQSIRINLNNSDFWNRRAWHCRLQRIRDYFTIDQIERMIGVTLYKLSPNMYTRLFQLKRSYYSGN